jgi:N-methylhydantoinase A
VHAYALARLLKVRRLIVPMGAGVISAFGFLVAAPAVDDARGYLVRLDRADWDEVNALFAEMEARAGTLLAGIGLAAGEIRYKWFADMHYLGQGFEITVPLPPGPLGPDKARDVRAAFDATYDALFDRIVSGVPVEAVNWRLRAAACAQSVSLVHAPADTRAERPTRKVFFPGYGRVPARVFDRYALRPGTKLSGPAVFEERESTFSVGPEATVTVDEHSNLVVDIRYRAPGAAEPQLEDEGEER